MHDQDGWIWYDGELVPWRSATTHVLTHSLHYGMAVFEGVRAYRTRSGPALFRVEEHIERLFASAHLCRMRIPFEPKAILAAHLESLRANALDAAYLRTIAFYGAEKAGISPTGARVHVAVAAFPWESYLGVQAKERGVRVKTATLARAPASASLPHAKLSGQYASSVLARQEANDDGYDEALLLDVDGFVGEGSGENLFIVRAGKLHEPEPTSALLGITRDAVRVMAQELGYEVVTRRLTRDDVYLADEAFFTGTAAEITPIVELDRRTIGGGRVGPVTRALMAAFERATRGEEPHYARWLTSLALNAS